ncbi:hypothetical protein B853_20449 [Vibrio rotiferianus CAIM 577 = LMG 21460]|nr:hypothetical protein B853_20449 [Vibrio rotiferianus CAIM 577 = LMG 21460]
MVDRRDISLTKQDGKFLESISEAIQTFVSRHHQRAEFLAVLFAPQSPLDSLGLSGAFLGLR